jgi:hypothetical protein
MSVIAKLKQLWLLAMYRASDVTHVTDMTVLIRAALMRLE